MRKLAIAILVALSFIGGSLSPKPNGQECKAEISRLKKDQGYKAGSYKIWYRSYRGKGGKTYQKIDIVGKQDLKGAIYKKGATIEEK